MKRIKLVLAVAAVTTTMLSLGAGPAGADACFDDFAREGGRPGEFVSGVARGAAQGVQPGSGTDELAREVGIVNQVRNDVCPK